MAESVSSTAAAPQPATTTVPSGVTTANNEVGENMTGSSVRAMLFKRDMARQAEPVASADVQAAPPAGSAESTTDQTAEDATQNAPEPDSPDAADGETPDAADDVSDDVHSHLSKLDPATRLLLQQAIEEDRRRNQEKIDKRIGKFKAKTAAAEQATREAQLQTQTLAAQIRQPQAPQASPAFDANQPLGEIQDHATLQKRAQDAKETVRFVNDVLDSDGIENGVEIAGKLWSKADLKAARRNAQITLEDHVPQRAAFLQNRDTSVKQAIEKFPFLKDTEHPGHKIAQDIVSSPKYAWLKTVPDAAELLGDLVEGKLAQAAKKAPVKPAAPIRQRPSSDQTVTTSVGGGSERVANGSRGLNALAAELARLNEKGNVSGGEVRDYLKRKDQFR